MNGNEQGMAAAVMAMGAVVWLVSLVVSLGICAAICWFLSSCLQKVPVEHQKQKPALVWLLMIPCFNIVWNFFVFPKVAESFKAYFDSIGRTDVGDCGLSMAKLLCILAAVLVPATILVAIPIVGALIVCALEIAVLVIFIITLVKFNGLKGQIQ